MNPEQLQQKIAEYYEKLPADMQTMFASMEWMKTLENLSTKYNMTPNQVQSLGTETTLLLLGIIHPDEYINFLKADLSLAKDTQDKLMADINLGILNKWREALTATYTQNTMDVAEKEYGGGMKLDERFDKLPKEVKDAIANSNYQKELYIIANEQKLSIDQMDGLEKATNKILLGIEHPDKYEKMLETDLGLASDKAIELSGIVNERILKNIRGLLKNNIENVVEMRSAIKADPAIPLPPYKMPVQAQANPIVQTTLTTPAFAIANTTVEKAPTPSAQKDVVAPPIINTEATFMPTPILDTKTAPMQNTNSATNMEPGNKVFTDSGIEMLDEVTVATPANIPVTENITSKEDTLMKNGGVNIVEDEIDVPLPPMEVNKNVEKDILDGIENPVPTINTLIQPKKVEPVVNTGVGPVNSLLKDTLSKPMVTIQGATDQSTPKTSSTDPYREPVE
ncbi:MAG: hypothetical protein QG566_147 [Patescibacteria group bacterium]|nr:hypothetical protein [Patescibacteria group bacterium]